MNPTNSAAFTLEQHALSVAEVRRNPSALAFASNIARSDAPSVAYATVYPLITLLRILCA